MLRNGKRKRLGRSVSGFTLTEMLVTLLIMVLASTLMATGIPVAVDTYRKVVNTSNAQLALSTTATVLKGELGTATDVRTPRRPGSEESKVIYYRTGEGGWAAIGPSDEFDGANYRGLVKQAFKGEPNTNDKNSVDGLTPIEGSLFPLISDSAITEPLHVRYDKVNAPDQYLVIDNFRVEDEDRGPTGPNILADMGSEQYSIMIRFSN